MKRLLLLCFSLSITLFGFSKSNFDRSPRWHEGVVVLQSGDTVRGMLQFTRKVSEGLLQLQRNTRVEILTVKEVSYFSYFDESRNATRQFYTVSFQAELGKRPHEFFIEYLYGNQKVWIMNHRTMGFSKRPFQFNPFRKRTVVNEQYLLNYQSGELLPMSKENVLDLMGDQKREALMFIQTNGLRLKSVDDFIALLDFQRSLF